MILIVLVHCRNSVCVCEVFDSLLKLLPGTSMNILFTDAQVNPKLKVKLKVVLMCISDGVYLMMVCNLSRLLK